MAEIPTSLLGVYVVVPGEPRSKARPRFTGNGRVYSEKHQRAHEEALRWHFRAAMRTPLPGNVAIEATFYRSTRQRVDIDNLLKSVLDGTNGVCFADDSQVTRIGARLELDPEKPRTEVLIRPTTSSLLRGKKGERVSTCPSCEREFTWRAYPSAPSKTFCSPRCRNRAPGRCVHCGRDYHRTTPRQLCCSPECLRARRSAATAAEPRPSCRDCSAPLIHRDAVLCVACWRASPNQRRKADV